MSKPLVADHTRNWWPLDRVAKELKVSQGRVYHLISDGRLMALRVNNLWRIDPDSVRLYAKYQSQLKQLRETKRPLTRL